MALLERDGNGVAGGLEGFDLELHALCTPEGMSDQRKTQPTGELTLFAVTFDLPGLGVDLSLGVL